MGESRGRGGKGKSEKQGGDSGERSRSLRMLEAKIEGPAGRGGKKRRPGKGTRGW